MKPCNSNLIKVMDISRDLLSIAEKGDADRDDDGCGVLYGLVRDSGYNLIRHTLNEIEKHKKSGKWEKTLDDLPLEL